MTLSTPETEETWALLWSRSQNCTHVEPVSKMLDTNRRAYANNTAMDYIPLFIGRQDEALAMSRSLRQTLCQRERQQNPAFLRMFGGVV